MAKTHVIDGVTYVEVERKAKIGDLVWLVNIKSDMILGEYNDIDGINLDIIDGYVKVLEPLESEEVTVDTSQASEQVIEMLAALSRKIVSLERQLADTQRNLETWAEQTENNSEDIRTLDERAQPKDVTVETTEPSLFDMSQIKSFKISDLNGKTLRVHSASDTANGVTATTTVAIDVNDGKMFVLESEVVSQ